MNFHTLYRVGPQNRREENLFGDRTRGKEKILSNWHLAACVTRYERWIYNKAKKSIKKKFFPSIGREKERANGNLIINFWR